MLKEYLTELDPLYDRIKTMDIRPLVEEAEQELNGGARARGSRYGERTDGSPKGKGFLGEIKMDDGRVMTELEIIVDGQKMPSIVPTLTDEQINYLKGGGDPRDRRDIVEAAVKHAMERTEKGLPVFFEQ